MLWVIFGGMLLAAIVFVVWPLYRREQSVSIRGIGIAVALVLVSAVTYNQTGQPDARFVERMPPVAGAGAPNSAATDESVEAMVASLAERLQSNPDDVDGWKMLGRSYIVVNQFADAVDALERAVALEDSSNPQTLADLGEAVFMNDKTALTGRAAGLFESALAKAPNNPKALFYSGMAAGARGENEVAATRWEALLATSPPPEIGNMIRQRVAEWRAEMTAPDESAAPLTAAATEGSGAQVDVDVSFGEEIEELNPKSTVFVIARDPAQPGPPIAVDRRLVEELPGRVTLTDANAMLPGRALSNFSEVEIVARISASGQPMAQSGDWFGAANVSLADESAVAIRIDQRTP